MPYRLLLLSFLILLTSPQTPAQDQLTDIDTARSLFWQSLYAAGGWTLYCGVRFEAGGGSDGSTVTVDQIYPMSRVYKALGCGSRLRCKQQRSDHYNRMEADLHNMYPATGAVVILRSDSIFAEIEGNESRYENCDFERQQRQVEPRDIAKGNIARTLLYMHQEYDLPLAEDIELLQSWNRVDPPSEQEISRNNVIERVQGNRNSFIDDPALADDL